MSHHTTLAHVCWPSSWLWSWLRSPVLSHRSVDRWFSYFELNSSRHWPADTPLSLGLRVPVLEWTSPLSEGPVGFKKYESFVFEEFFRSFRKICDNNVFFYARSSPCSVLWSVVWIFSVFVPFLYFHVGPDGVKFWWQTVFVPVGAESQTEGSDVCEQ